MKLLDGLSKGSVSKFTEVFKLESIMYHSDQTSTTYSGGSHTTLSAIPATLLKATDLYNSLSTGNNWHIPSGHAHSCWNCDGDHGVNKCKLLKDQARIQANKKKWEEEKKKKYGSGGNGSNSGNQYERSRFGRKKGDSKQPGNGGVKKFNNVWHMHCNKGFGSMLLLPQIHLPFLLHCLQPIPIIRGLQKSNIMDFLHYLIVFLPSTNLLLVPATMALLTRPNSWLFADIMNAW